MTQSGFDRFAASYDEDLAQALSVTGENKDYYAQARVTWSASCIKRIKATTERILDFGCGIGSNSPILCAGFKAKFVLGIDVSEHSIFEARGRYESEQLKFSTIAEYTPDGGYDLVFCNGVFHHILPEERHAALRLVVDSLKPGGLFVLWENNPWNPGTKYVMSRCVFDEDAITISIPAARKLLRSAGFHVLRSDTQFYFPKQLSWLRPMEKLLASLPLGGQYQVLCRKPEK
jgi:trans-aconitate methyltransferase